MSRRLPHCGPSGKWFSNLLLLTAILLGPGCTEKPGETLSFVVFDWTQQLGNVTHAHCPEGLNVSEIEYFGISEGDFRRDVSTIGYEAATARHLPGDACRDVSAQADPGFQFLQLPLHVGGLDLDGVASSREDNDRCAHDDFLDENLAPGIDNQFARLMGCTAAYQRIGQDGPGKMKVRHFREPGSAILIEITDIQDRQNDPEVTLRVVSSPDIVPWSQGGVPLHHASFSEHPDPRYRSGKVRGFLADGKLRTDPFDMKLQYRDGVVDHELAWRDVRIEANLEPNGELAGTIGYYWEAENLFRVANDHEIDGRHTGRLAAIARGYMCAGMYHAIWRLADGHFDAEKGHCTTVSAAHSFRAMPAFVIRRQDGSSEPR